MNIPKLTEEDLNKIIEEYNFVYFFTHENYKYFYVANINEPEYVDDVYIYDTELCKIYWHIFISENNIKVEELLDRDEYRIDVLTNEIHFDDRNNFTTMEMPLLRPYLQAGKTQEEVLHNIFKKDSKMNITTSVYPKSTLIFIVVFYVLFGLLVLFVDDISFIRFYALLLTVLVISTNIADYYSNKKGN